MRGVLRNYLLKHLHGAEAGNEVHAQCFARIGRCAGNRLRQPLSEPGMLTAEQIIADVPAGLYVTGLIGFGVNVGHWRLLARRNGLWIENGVLTHAVEEVTIGRQSSRHAAQRDRHRQRFGISRRSGFAYAAD